MTTIKVPALISCAGLRLRLQPYKLALLLRLAAVKGTEPVAVLCFEFTLGFNV